METTHLDKAEFLAPEAPQRGVAPGILLEQIRNTVPFLFGPEGEAYEDLPYVKLLRTTDPAAPLTHPQYYRLCLSAHHATVASFVPTDVDNQIRFKLWPPTLPTETVLELVAIVRESGQWDWTRLQGRFAVAPSGEKMSGHNGEWFSTAAAAYGALRRRSPDHAAAMAGDILRELRRELAIFAELRQARDGIGLMKAAVVIAHNLGDLERVFEMWNVGADDPLVEAVEKEKATREQKLSAELNRRWGAPENHRHFALRSPRCIRRGPEYFLPLAPFLDDWGGKLARTLEPEETAEVIEALVDGWQWLEKNKQPTVGYGRAIAGMEESFPGGPTKLHAYLPKRVARDIQGGTMRATIAVPRRRFEEQWKQMALNLVKSF